MIGVPFRSFRLVYREDLNNVVSDDAIDDVAAIVLQSRLKAAGAITPGIAMRNLALGRSDRGRRVDVQDAPDLAEWHRCATVPRRTSGYILTAPVRVDRLVVQENFPLSLKPSRRK